MLTYTTEHGYLEGILRGYRGALLTTAQYGNLCHCETLDDLKVQLGTISDYHGALQEDPGISAGSLREKLRADFVEKFKYLMGNATGKLRAFLEYTTYGYMIDNVVLVLAGCLKKQGQGQEEDKKSAGERLQKKAEELLRQCHPLGVFDALPALTVASGSLEEVHRTVLVETPLGRYLNLSGRSLNEQLSLSPQSISALHVEVIRGLLWRAYLEDFCAWCSRQLDSTSAALMKELLGKEADRRSLAIAVNSLGASALSREQRQALLPRLGDLYEWGLVDRLARAEDLQAIKSVVDSHPGTASRFSPGLEQLLSMPAVPEKTALTDIAQVPTLEDLMASEEVDQCKSIFEHPANYAAFYSWAKLKEQEARNVVWIAECISQRQKSQIHEYIPLW